MSTTTKPSEGAVRAASILRKRYVSASYTPEEVMAEIIDRETHAGEMLEALERLHIVCLQTPAMADDHDNREVMDNAWAVIRRARGGE